MQRQWAIGLGIGVAVMALAMLRFGVPFVDAGIGADRHIEPPTGFVRTEDGGQAEREVVLSREPQSTRPETSAAHVTPDDLGTTVGAIDPVDVVDGDITVSTDHELIADTTVNGCLVIDADDVTVRNVIVNCGDGYPIKVNGASGTRLENVTIDCLDDPRSRKGVFFEFADDFGVDRVEIRGCDDQFFVDGGLGESWITNSVFHEQIPAEEAHTDGVQVGEFELTTGRLVIEGNWWEYDREGCCDNAVVFASSHAELEIEVIGNYLDGDFGTHLIRCHGRATCLVVGNVVGAPPAGLVLEADDTDHVAGCNTYVGGAPVDAGLFARTTMTDDC